MMASRIAIAADGGRGRDREERHVTSWQKWRGRGGGGGEGGGVKRRDNGGAGGRRGKGRRGHLVAARYMCVWALGRGSLRV